MRENIKSVHHLLITLLLCLLLFTFFAYQPTACAHTLQLNSRGEQVILVQTRLKALGYNITKISGQYDNSTHRAVMAFQRDHKIKITGKVDDKTLKAINTAKPLSKPHATVLPKKHSKPSIIQMNQKPATGIFNPTDLNAKKPGFVPETQPFLPRSKTSTLIATAKKFIGTPYKFGGTTPKAFDCSGYIQYIFATQGIKLPRTADEQYKLGKNYAVTKLEAGDLVFFSTDSSGDVSHIGIYLGYGQFIHASSSRGVVIDKLSGDYWAKHLYGGKHIVY